MLDLVRKIIEKERKVGFFSPKPLLVSLLHCLYEAQDSFICQFVAKQLEGELNFRHISLIPVDCHAVGYFISFLSVTTNSVKEFTVNLGSCSLGDACTKSLMQSICRSVDPHSTANIHLDMHLISNNIHE